MPVLHVAHLLLHRRDVLALQAEIAAEPPGLHRVAPVAQECLHRSQRNLAAQESRDQQDRVAVAARRAQQERQRLRQHREFEGRAQFQSRVQRARRAVAGRCGSH
jgi:hypothetical protein